MFTRLGGIIDGHIDVQLFTRKPIVKIDRLLQSSVRRLHSTEGDGHQLLDARRPAGDLGSTGVVSAVKSVGRELE